MLLDLNDTGVVKGLTYRKIVNEFITIHSVVILHVLFRVKIGLLNQLGIQSRRMNVYR